MIYIEALANRIAGHCALPYLAKQQGLSGARGGFGIPPEPTRRPDSGGGDANRRPLAPTEFTRAGDWCADTTHCRRELSELVSSFGNVGFINFVPLDSTICELAVLDSEAVEKIAIFVNQRLWKVSK